MQIQQFTASASGFFPSASSLPIFLLAPGGGAFFSAAPGGGFLRLVARHRFDDDDGEDEGFRFLEVAEATDGTSSSAAASTLVDFSPVLI